MPDKLPFSEREEIDSPDFLKSDLKELAQKEINFEDEKMLSPESLSPYKQTENLWSSLEKE